MNVSDAITARHSTRAFRPDPISADEVRDMLSIAARAPSGGNLQPWMVHVIAGDAIAELKQQIAHKFQAGERETPEYNVYPTGLWEPLRSRRSEAARRRFVATGVTENDEGTRLMQARNYAFFDAPVGLFFSIDRRAGPPQWADVGMFMQNFMLLAVERGMATCPQMIWANWPVSLARFLQIPDSFIMYSGMSLGYPDPQSPWNSFRTEREPVEGFARFIGF